MKRLIQKKINRKIEELTLLPDIIRGVRLQMTDQKTKRLRMIFLVSYDKKIDKRFLRSFFSTLFGEKIKSLNTSIIKDEKYPTNRKTRFKSNPVSFKVPVKRLYRKVFVDFVKSPNLDSIFAIYLPEISRKEEKVS